MDRMKFKLECRDRTVLARFTRNDLHLQQTISYLGELIFLLELLPDLAKSRGKQIDFPNQQPSEFEELVSMGSAVWQARTIMRDFESLLAIQPAYGVLIQEDGCFLVTSPYRSKHWDVFHIRERFLGPVLAMWSDLWVDVRNPD